MKKKTKLYFRLNLISLFFVVVSFISVTLAWFVYSGLSTVSTEVNVKAWYIELEKDGEAVSNNIVISLDDIYPGMVTMEEEIKIKNLGDSNAQVKYEIASVRILDKEQDNYVINDSVTSDYVEDKISHDYPFHINIDLSKKFILAGTDESTFKVSISWPLDSGTDELDSIWGTEAYKFKLAEQDKKNLDNSYQIRASIKLEILLTAEQYIETPESSDIEYRLGNEILYDVNLNKRCTDESTTCIRTNVIDVNNKIGDKTVTLLPKISTAPVKSTFNDINTSYLNQVASWKVQSRLLNISDVLNVVSKDIKNSTLVRPNISDLVIGKLMYENSMNNLLTLATGRYTVQTDDNLDKIANKYNTTVKELIDLNNLTNTELSIGQIIEIPTTGDGYFKYLNKFSYFYSTDCYWLNNEYDVQKSFAVAPLDDNLMKIYGELKNTSCKVIPVIIADKVNLKTN